MRVGKSLKCTYTYRCDYLEASCEMVKSLVPKTEKHNSPNSNSDRRTGMVSMMNVFANTATPMSGSTLLIPLTTYP
jgi:hypothetical protein